MTLNEQGNITMHINFKGVKTNTDSSFETTRRQSPQSLYFNTNGNTPTSGPPINSKQQHQLMTLHIQTQIYDDTTIKNPYNLSNIYHQNQNFPLMLSIDWHQQYQRQQNSHQSTFPPQQ